MGRKSLQEQTMKNSFFVPQKLQQTVKYIMRDREMEERYMLLEELLKEEYNRGKVAGMAEARAEARAKGITVDIPEGIVEDVAYSFLHYLAKYIDISEEARTRISTITDIAKLDELFATALNLNSVEDLEEFIQNL